MWQFIWNNSIHILIVIHILCSGKMPYVVLTYEKCWLTWTKQTSLIASEKTHHKLHSPSEAGSTKQYFLECACEWLGNWQSSVCFRGTQWDPSFHNPNAFPDDSEPAVQGIHPSEQGPGRKGGEGLAHENKHTEPVRWTTLRWTLS